MFDRRASSKLFLFCEITIGKHGKKIGLAPARQKCSKHFFNWEITRNVNLRWKLICNFIWTSLHFISKSIKLEVFQLALFPKVENIPNVIVTIPTPIEICLSKPTKSIFFCFEYISVFLTAFDNVKKQLTFVLYIKISQLLWQFNVV